MNKQLQEFARAQIQDGLSRLPAETRTFKLMYGRNNGRRSVADALAMNLSEIVAQMPADKLDWAMQQVENSLAKRAKLSSHQEATAEGDAMAERPSQSPQSGDGDSNV